MNDLIKKTFYSNLIQNLSILIIGIIYFVVFQIKGIEQVAFVLFTYIIYFAFLLIEFFYYEKIQIPKFIKGYNLLSFSIVFIFLLGGIDLLSKKISMFLLILILLINFSRFVIFFFCSKKKDIEFKNIDTVTSNETENLNFYEKLVLFFSFIFLIIKLSTKIEMMISIAFIAIYFIIYHNKINNFMLNFVLIIILIILSYFGISGIINYSVSGLIFMLLFRRKKVL